jgi:hypothetical protein
MEGMATGHSFKWTILTRFELAQRSFRDYQLIFVVFVCKNHLNLHVHNNGVAGTCHNHFIGFMSCFVTGVFVHIIQNFVYCYEGS